MSGIDAQRSGLEAPGVGRPTKLTTIGVLTVGVSAAFMVIALTVVTISPLSVASTCN